jgi:hypothetical protein
MMIVADANHCRIVSRALAGERAIDERTFASLAILSERLSRLRKLDRVFSRVEFSPDVKKLKGQRNAVPIG